MKSPNNGHQEFSLSFQDSTKGVKLTIPSRSAQVLSSYPTSYTHTPPRLFPTDPRFSLPTLLSGQGCHRERCSELAGAFSTSLSLKQLSTSVLIPVFLTSSSPIVAIPEEVCPSFLFSDNWAQPAGTKGQRISSPLCSIEKAPEEERIGSTLTLPITRPTVSSVLLVCAQTTQDQARKRCLVTCLDFGLQCNGAQGKRVCSQSNSKASPIENWGAPAWGAGRKPQVRSPRVADASLDSVQSTWLTWLRPGRPVHPEGSLCTAAANASECPTGL